MKIGIDARLIEETGVGRYIRNLIVELGKSDYENEYVIFLKQPSYDAFALPNHRWQKRLANVPWHSVQEQIHMPILFLKERLDLVHIPYFNVPILYPKRFVVTIHDLILLHFATGKASTLPWWKYRMRHLAYRFVLQAAIMRARHVLTVSQTVEQEIEGRFGKSKRDITVTYEGVDEGIGSAARGEKALVSGAYFLYVGNAYPHKNLETLLAAFDKTEGATKLVLVGRHDFFYERIAATIGAMKRASDVVRMEQVSDNDLANLYAHATALVIPSFMEGFGLPPLEALSMGCRVIASDIPVFHETLDMLPVYVSPTDVSAWATVLDTVSQEAPRDEFVTRAKQWTAKYSWKTMAQQTLAAYVASI